MALTTAATANITFPCSLTDPRKLAIRGTMVWFSELKSIDVIAKSLYARRKLKRPVVITPGHITGIITCLKAWNLVHPSTMALSSISLGILRKQYEKFYSVTDEKFNKDEFEKNVNEENRLQTKGIEVGHIFYFGDKYSKPMNASVDYNGKKEFVKMGSYGIGVSRLVGAIIEAKYDDKNEIMKWPLSVAPYDIALIPMINKNDTSALDKANNINIELIKNNIDAIIDDTDENFSSKIKKMNLIGAPYQIIIGKKSEGDLLEFKETGGETQNLPLSKIIEIITKQKNSIWFLL